MKFFPVPSHLLQTYKYQFLNTTPDNFHIWITCESVSVTFFFSHGLVIGLPDEFLLNTRKYYIKIIEAADDAIFP